MHTHIYIYIYIRICIENNRDIDMTLIGAEGQKEGCSRTTWRRLHHQVGLCRHLFELGGQMPTAEPEFIE